MDTNEIINLGRTGNTRTSEIAIFEFGSSELNAYETIMSIYMKQNSMTEKAYIQVKDDTLSFALHGKLGNMLFVSMSDFFLTEEIQRRSIPIQGDFLLEGTENLADLSEINRAKLAWQDENELGNLNGNTRMVTISAHKRNNYGGAESTLFKSRTSVVLHIGITSFSIPLTWLPIKGGYGRFTELATQADRESDNNNNRNRNNSAESIMNRYLRSEPPLDISLMTHIIHNESQSYGYASDRNSTVNLIHTMRNESIVKDALPNDYDLANVDFLCEMPVGTIRKAITKIKKSKPFGKMTVHYNTTDQPMVIVKVTNGTDEVQTTSISNNIIYSRPNITGTSSISYSTWFDTVETKKSSAPSMWNIHGSVPRTGASGGGRSWQHTEQNPVTEILGVTTNGALLYGLKNGNMTIMTTLSILSTTPAYDGSVMVTDNTKTKKKVTRSKSIKAPIVLSEEEILAQVMAQATLRDDPFYIKWKEVSDQYCEDRGEQQAHEVRTVFLNYLQSQPVTTEDQDAFKRLTS